MADQNNTAETGTNNAATTAAAKAGFVNFDLAGAALLHTNLEKSCRWVLVALCSYANRTHHQAWPSVSSLAERAGCSERTARAQLRQLERAGYIRTVRNGAYSTTAYQIEATKLQLEQAAGTTTTPFFAPTEIAGGAAKTAWGAAKTVTERAEIAAKERKEERIEEKKEEGGNAHAHATPTASLTEAPTFPPLPSSVFENLPALNSPAVARSTAPAPAPAPAPSADTLANLPDDLIDSINAQRQRNGKGKLTQRDINGLSTEATKAGITTVAAAQWVLAKPGRNFFRADYYKPETAPADAPATPAPSAAAVAAQKVLASMIPPAPQTDEEKAAAAQAAAAARARLAEHRTALESKLTGTTANRVNGPKNLFAAITGTTAPTTSAAAVEPWQPLPEVGGTAWAAKAINAHMRGEQVGFAKLDSACQALKTSRAALQARRAATITATA